MAQFRKLTREEIAAIMEPQPRSARAAERRRIIEEYKQFLSEIAPGEGGEIILEEGDKRQTIKNRLKRAAKDLGIELEFKRKRGRIVFRVPDTAQAEEGEA